MKVLPLILFNDHSIEFFALVMIPLRNCDDMGCSDEDEKSFVFVLYRQVFPVSFLLFQVISIPA